MNTSTPTGPEPALPNPSFKALCARLGERLRDKRISYFTVPLILAATVAEFVILATSFKYQQTVCVPNGMGVTFFGIGPIGATILAVELLKLPLAIWTASRTGWQKGFMLLVGLPLICVLTFQLVKDMAVYEMEVAMRPASAFHEKAAAEEIKIAQLEGELQAVETKKTERDQKLEQLAAKKAKGKADLEEALKRNEESRHDAITLTDYQKKELSEVEVRQAAIIKQFDADTEQLNKALADLRARREKELSRATEWNAEEARLENDYKARLAIFTNAKNTYDKARADYDNANVLRRQLMKEPVSPGVPPEREVNKLLKPTVIAELDAQIKTKEAELATVNARRRDRVAQVSEDARRVREEFDRRSTTKRDEADKKREELTAALATMTAGWLAEEKAIEQEYDGAARKVDTLRAEADAARQRANEHYEAREAAIKGTQVHRIATTVEIVRSLIFGQRPISITATAKERGDLHTDQISMVRVWVYPVLAFIVAFLPTLMVEIGFSTLFQRESKQPAHRLGFLGRRLHWVNKRAGRLKILRAERLAREATTALTARDRARAAEQAAADQALAAKDAEVQAAREALASAAGQHDTALQRQEAEWVAKLASTTDSLNRALAEKDALRDLQKAEVERQVQLRQNAWSERVTQLTQEMDELRAAAETERVTLRQEQQKRLAEAAEQSRAQLADLRRQLADAELAALETAARAAHEVKESLRARDEAESQLQSQSETAARQLAHARDEAARAAEKAIRQEKLHAEQQQQEFAQQLRQSEESFAQRLRQREQEWTLAADARLAEEIARLEQDARRRLAQAERDADARTRDLEARWKQEVQRRDEAAQLRMTQREQQWQALAESGVRDAQAQAEQELRRHTAQFTHQLEAQARAAEARLQHELQQQEMDLQTRLKQRDQQWQAQLDTHNAEARARQDAEAQRHEQELQRATDAATRTAESRRLAELQQREESFSMKLRQREQQWQAKLDAALADTRSQLEQEFRGRAATAAEASQRNLEELETRVRKEMQDHGDALQTRTRQREQELLTQLAAQEQHLAKARTEWAREVQSLQSALAPLKAQLVNAEQARAEAARTAAESTARLQEIERKMTEASSLLLGRKAASGSNGNGANAASGPGLERMRTDSVGGRGEF